jgi:hypothetical protein
MVTAIRVDGFKPGRNDSDNFVLTTLHQFGQRCADAAFVVCNQNPHGAMMAEKPMPAERISRFPLVEI